MSWERDLLLAIRQAQGPLLDTAFLLSHELGTIQFGVALVLALVLAHAARGERRAALLWLLVGLSTALLQWQLKEIVGRPRPQLWPWLQQPSGAAWPSGHALSTATFFPLLAWQAARRWPAHASAAWATALALVAFVGVGRLYLGVHWPTDVLGGWLLGAAQAAVALRFLRPPAR